MLRYLYKLTTHVQDLHEKNYKTLIKDKTSVVLNLISKFIACNPNPNPTNLFCGYQQTHSKVYLKR